MTTQTQPTDEQRLSRLEGAFEQMNERFGELARSQEAFRVEVNGRIDALRSDMDAGFDKLRSEMASGLKELRSDISSRSNLMIALLGGILASVLGGVIAIITQG